jgi:hypothetical protein
MSHTLHKKKNIDCLFYKMTTPSTVEIKSVGPLLDLKQKKPIVLCHCGKIKAKMWDFCKDCKKTWQAPELICSVCEKPWKKEEKHHDKCRKCYEKERRKFLRDKVREFDGNLSTSLTFSGAGYLPLPKFFHDKKCIINPDNNDNKCFMWCHLMALNNVGKSKGRTSKYTQFQNQVNYNDISFPVTIDQVPMIENLNNVRFYIYGVNESCESVHRIYPLCLKKHYNAEMKDIHLILFQDKKLFKSHFCYVQDFNALLSTQYSRDKNKGYFCLNCMNRHSTKENLDKHLKDCLIDLYN